MKAIKDLFDEKLLKQLDEKLQARHLEYMHDQKYRVFFESFGDSSLYTECGLFMRALREQEHCKDCQRLVDCQNKLHGHQLMLKMEQGLIEEYVPCNYYQERLRQALVYYVGVHNELHKASLDKLHIDDDSRVQVLQAFKKLLHNQESKGFYLYGKFGTGKTYMMSAFINMMSDRGLHCGLIYFPRLLVELKKSYTDKTNYLDKIMKIDVLVLDDLGAEHMTSWSRDEVLGTILQYRMENELLTFFTSNLSLKELEVFYSRDKSEVNARRIIDRIKFLAKPYGLFNKQYR